MRVLVVSTLYPPVALGGYEVECSSVTERLGEQHDVLVLTSAKEHRTAIGADSAFSRVQVRRELTLLTPDETGALRAPLASLRAVGTARRALKWGPDLIYAWNGASIPQAALRIFADSGVPLAFRVCEHWFGGLFLRDQFMRELLPASRGPARASWAAGCRALNLLPALRLDGHTYKLDREGKRAEGSDERDFSVWISDDEGRVPLQVTAKTDYGDVKLAITDYQPGTARKD